MKFKTTLAAASFLLLALIACNNAGKKNTEQSLPDPLVTNRDTTVNPAADFFHYADGGWFKRNPIPASENSNGIFKTIDDTINQQVKRVCIEASGDTKAAKGSNKQKIGDFFASGMDTVSIDKNGITPLNDMMKKIDEVKDVKSLM